MIVFGLIILLLALYKIEIGGGFSRDLQPIP